MPLKEELYQHCLTYIEQRIHTAQKAIDDAREASQSETKSSAGDKYETGRAMMQQDIDRNRLQLAETAKLKQSLERINSAKQHSRVQPGSLVITDNGNFYLAISAGQVSLAGNTYYIISSASPIGLKLAGLTAGNECSVNGKNFKIKEVF